MRTIPVEFITSDMHVGHSNIRRWRGIPDWSIEAMNDLIVKAWNSVVPEGATVAVLGDAVMGKRHESLPYLDQMNGTKILFPGNHDNCWIYNRKRITERNDWPQVYLGYFDELMHDGMYDIPGIGEVQISHFPRYGDHTDEERYAEMRPPVVDSWLLHGHVHSLWRVKDNMLNVGMDAWGVPLSVAQVADIMADGPREVGVPFDFADMMRHMEVI